jgi:hypothetical protein
MWKAPTLQPNQTKSDKRRHIAKHITQQDLTTPVGARVVWQGVPVPEPVPFSVLLKSSSLSSPVMITGASSEVDDGRASS